MEDKAEPHFNIVNVSLKNPCNEISETLCTFLKKLIDTRSPRVSFLIRHAICATDIHAWLFNATIHRAVRDNLQMNRYDHFSCFRRPSSSRSLKSNGNVMASNARNSCDARQISMATGFIQFQTCHLINK